MKASMTEVKSVRDKWYQPIVLTLREEAPEPNIASTRNERRDARKNGRKL